MSAAPLDRLLEAEPVQVARRALDEAGIRAWAVGGAVRDALLGRPVRDVDLAVDGPPEQGARAIARAGRGPAFQLSEAFGAWRAMGGADRWTCDVSPLQGETIEDDLARRDFTVNAMAVPLDAPAGAAPIDPHGGARDLERRVLRVLDGAYESDPLRPLRLARLATELDLAPDPETERLTRAAAAGVSRASPERVFAELRRLIAADRVLAGVELADGLGLVAAVLPELAALHGVEQSRYHHLDVHGHTIEVLSRLLDVEREPQAVLGSELGARVHAALAEPLADELTRWQALRFAALLHDVGKPATRGVRDDGRVTFIGHDAVGEEMARAACRRLRTSERLASFLGAVTRHHLTLGFLVHQRPLSRAAVYRYLKSCEPVELEVTVLTCADRLATRGASAERAIALHLELARQLAAEALDWRARPPRAPVRGDELAAELDIPPGPEIGALLAQLEEAAFAGEASTREDALALARRLRQNSPT
ncbi:MAG TPA: HD domain-containing protein [Thermoleophilaceae bacterium]|jgi:putative nucleotidyltransferase with HDIG domain